MIAPETLERDAVELTPVQLASRYSLTPGQFSTVAEVAAPYRAAVIRVMKGWRQTPPKGDE